MFDGSRRFKMAAQLEMDAHAALRSAGLASDAVLRWLEAEEVLSLDDVRSLFWTEEEARRVAPCMVAPWAWALKVGPASW